MTAMRPAVLFSTMLTGKPQPLFLSSKPTLTPSAPHNHCLPSYQMSTKPLQYEYHKPPYSCDCFFSVLINIIFLQHHAFNDEGPYMDNYGPLTCCAKLARLGTSRDQFLGSKGPSQERALLPTLCWEFIQGKKNHSEIGDPVPTQCLMIRIAAISKQLKLLRWKSSHLLSDIHRVGVYVGLGIQAPVVINETGKCQQWDSGWDSPGHKQEPASEGGETLWRCHCLH